MLGGSEQEPPRYEAAQTAEFELGALELDRPPFDERPVKPVERTRALLAYLLLGLIAAIIGVLLGFLGAGIINTDQLNSSAGILLAPVFGLLGAATGYYYGKGNR